jgi:biopolymer transport protein ExbD
MTMVVSLLNILLVMLSAFTVVVTMSTVRVVVEKCQAKDVG